jgi:hypothetical protein
MTMFSSVLPWLGQILIFSVLLTLLLQRVVKNKQRLIILVMGLLPLALFLPIQGLASAQWMRSVLGDLSVLTIIVMLNIQLQRWFDRSLITPSSRSFLLSGVLLAGVVLYPLALGLTAFDAYQLGYTPVLIPVILGGLSIYAWFSSKRDLSIVLLLPLMAHNLNLLESTNLWDYLLDPVLFIYALVQSPAIIKTYRSKKKETQLEQASAGNR